MNMTAVRAALAVAQKLTLNEQSELNRLLVANIKHDRRIESYKVAATLNVGDKVTFDAKTRGIITIQIDEFSRDGSKVKGRQIGGFNAGVRWTASASVCTKV